MTRREAREQAFCILFERSFQNETMDEILHAAQEARDLILSEYAENVAFGVEEHQAEIDELISGKLKGWSLARLSKVTASLLRLSVYEMLYVDDVPVGASINEAVELAKTYGGKDDPAYLNGVLGAIASELTEQRTEEQP